MTLVNSNDINTHELDLFITSHGSMVVFSTTFVLHISSYFDYFIGDYDKICHNRYEDTERSMIRLSIESHFVYHMN